MKHNLLYVAMDHFPRATWEFSELCASTNPTVL
jgi:hypothetical protein